MEININWHIYWHIMSGFIVEKMSQQDSCMKINIKITLISRSCVLIWFFYKNSNSAHSILKSSNFIQRSFICCRGYKTGRICLTFFIFKDGERYTYSVKWFRFIVNIYGLEKCHDLELCFLLLYTTNMESLQKFSALGFMFSLIDTKQQDCRIKYLGKKDLVIFWFHFNLFKFIDHMVISAYLK